MAITPVSRDLVLMPPTTDTMLSVIERAVMSPEFDVMKLQALLELREKYERLEARKAYVEAMNAFKLNPPTIVKNKQVSYGNTNYKHATLDNVCDAVINGLSAVGISHRWSVKQDDKHITVSCVLTHKLGHSEETTLMAPADTSGSKNAIQAIGSTVTYLERYTLMAACGLAAGEDDDGRGAYSHPQGQQTPAGGIVETKRMDAGVLAEHLEFLENAGSKEELEKLFRQYYNEAKAIRDQQSMNAIIAKKDKLKADRGY